MMEEKLGHYMYCLIETDEDREFDPIGIAGPDNKVYTVCHDGLAAVVSDSSVKKYDLSRANMLAHQRVNEMVLKDYVILPFKFCTIAEERRLIAEKVCIPKRKEFDQKFVYMQDKQEHGVRILWNEMESVFHDLLEQRTDLRKLRDRLATLPPEKSRQQKVNLGEQVKEALEAYNAKVQDELFQLLAPLAVESKKNKLHGDRMVLNAAFLIQHDAQGAFDAKIAECSERFAERMQWKYFGPTQPSNFVEIVVHWD